MSCRNTQPFRRDYIGRTDVKLRARTGFTSCRWGNHGSVGVQEFNLNFHTTCGRFANYVHAQSAPSRLLDWVGHVGITVCKDGFHGEGRAFDLSIVSFANGSRIDTNVFWNPAAPCNGGTLLHRRYYVGLAAAARQFVGTVLTAWYNAEHHDHIHFDNGVGVVPIRTGARTDVTLVQAACNYLNGESLAIDGAWGSATEAAYQRLLRRLRIQCRNPKANTSHAVHFFHLIARAGLKGEAAGRATDVCS
jgi:Extensin-like protein C-terminus